MNTIVDTRLRVLRAPVEDGIAMSFAPLNHRAAVLVELKTADGHTGYGESWINYPPWASAERVATLTEGVFPLVRGKDARRIVEVQQELFDRLEPYGRQWGAHGPIAQAISAIDMALWDLAGQAHGQAISWLVGGRCRENVPVYASSLGPTGVGEHARDCRAAGHTAVKVKLGFGRDADERILAEARAELGEDVTLYADANQAWTVAEAAAMAPMLRSYQVSWVEEPVRGDDLADLEELHRRTNLVLATGENIYRARGFRAVAASPAVAILQPDVAKTGGFTECLAICHLASAHGKSVFPHLYGGAVAFAATLQLAAHARSVAAVEYDIRHNPLRDPLICDPPRPTGGVLAVPDIPGLGLHLEPTAVAATTVESSAGLADPSAPAG